MKTLEKQAIEKVFEYVQLENKRISALVWDLGQILNEQKEKDEILHQLNDALDGLQKAKTLINACLE